jgi:hypothetical protein
MTEFKIEHILKGVLEICESTFVSFSCYKYSEYFKSIPDSLEVWFLMVHG